MTDYWSGFWVWGRPEALLFVLVFSAFGLIYLSPTFIAERQRHHDISAIAFVNVFFGWTVLGWLASMGWSLLPRRGIQALGSEARERAAPKVEKLKENVERHPLFREAGRQVDRALGGKLRRYEPPAEGTKSLISEWVITRDIEGAMHIAARLLLPMKSQISVTIFSDGGFTRFTMVRTELDTGGQLSVGPLTNAGRPFKSETFLIRTATLPFTFGTHEDWIIDAVGENGSRLPHSATIPADPEFPQAGRLLQDNRRIQFPAITAETKRIEAVKTASFGPSGTRTVEEVMRDRFAARPDETIDAIETWKVEQVGEGLWIVSFQFRRKGRPRVARWEVNAVSGSVRFLDPEAKALSLS